MDSRDHGIHIHSLSEEHKVAFHFYFTAVWVISVWLAATMGTLVHGTYQNHAIPSHKQHFHTPLFDLTTSAASPQKAERAIPLVVEAAHPH